MEHVIYDPNMIELICSFVYDVQTLANISLVNKTFNGVLFSESSIWSEAREIHRDMYKNKNQLSLTTMLRLCGCSRRSDNMLRVFINWYNYTITSNKSNILATKIYDHISNHPSHVSSEVSLILDILPNTDNYHLIRQIIGKAEDKRDWLFACERSLEGPNAVLVHKNVIDRCFDFTNSMGLYLCDYNLGYKLLYVPERYIEGNSPALPPSGCSLMRKMVYPYALLWNCTSAHANRSSMEEKTSNINIANENITIPIKVYYQDSRSNSIISTPPLGDINYYSCQCPGEKQIVSIVRQITDGMMTLRENGIETFLRIDRVFVYGTIDNPDIKISDWWVTFRDTPIYGGLTGSVAPEYENRLEHSEKSWIFTLGYIMLMLVTGKAENRNYKSYTDVFDRHPVSRDMRHFVLCCLSPEINRISANDIYNHPLLSDM